MSSISQLYELQEIDLEIDRLRETLAGVESQLGERSALDQAIEDLAKEEEKLTQIQKKQRDLEWTLEDLQGKIHVMEGKLYGGSIRNPKELESLREEAEHSSKRRKEQEDRILELMAEVEALDKAVRQRRKEVAGMEMEWKASQERLSKEKARLSNDLESLTAKKRGLVERLDASTVDLYETLRTTKQGLAVVRVERGMCCGCRIVLPMTDLQRAKLGREVVLCNSCSRILYVS